MSPSQRLESASAGSFWSIRIKDQNYRRLREEAAREGRSATQQLNKILEKRYEKNGDA